MFVRDVMTPIVQSVSTSDCLADALRVMADSGFESLVVTEQRVPLGIVSLKQAALFFLQNPAASPEKLCVREVFTATSITVEPDDVIEEAAYKLERHDLDALPVVSPESGRLAGVISPSDVLRAFVYLLGLRSRSSRITLRVNDRVGALADICQIVKRSGLSIASLATFRAENQDEVVVVLRVRSTDVGALLSTLNAAGYKVVHEACVWE